MATNGSRPHRVPRNRKEVVGPRNASVGVLPAFRPEDMLTAYNANIDTTVQLLNAAFSTLSRFQHLQAERGEQVLLLAGKTMSALSRAAGQDAFAAQAGLTREALDSMRSYWEQVLMLSDEARREVLQLVERQWRFDGIALQSSVATHTRRAEK